MAPADFRKIIRADLETEFPELSGDLLDAATESEVINSGRFTNPETLDRVEAAKQYKLNQDQLRTELRQNRAFAPDYGLATDEWANQIYVPRLQTTPGAETPASRATRPPRQDDTAIVSTPMRDIPTIQVQPAEAPPQFDLSKWRGEYAPGKTDLAAGGDVSSEPPVWNWDTAELAAPFAAGELPQTNKENLEPIDI